MQGVPGKPLAAIVYFFTTRAITKICLSVACLCEKPKIVVLDARQPAEKSEVF
jgi:hypothetical protein